METKNKNSILNAQFVITKQKNENHLKKLPERGIKRLRSMMLLFNIAIGLVIYFIGFYIGKDAEAKSKIEKQIEWQQGYNKGWSDAVNRKVEIK